MEKKLSTQKILFAIFASVQILVFIYALCFMTDFKNLFGLHLKVNQDITFFHDVLMQTFNQQLFWASLFGLVVILIAFLLEIEHVVPDLFALVAMSACLVFLLVFSVFSLIQFPYLQNLFISLDFSNLDREGAMEYLPRTRTFVWGAIVHITQITISICFFFSLIFSHFEFIKQERRNGRDE